MYGDGSTDPETDVHTRASSDRTVGGARASLIIGALGVVFGDIGTSPLYTVQTVFNPSDHTPPGITLLEPVGAVELP